jgi:hypothetical protein
MNTRIQDYRVCTKTSSSNIPRVQYRNDPTTPTTVVLLPVESILKVYNRVLRVRSTEYDDEIKREDET